jgi:Uma2 family endonuclease
MSMTQSLPQPRPMLIAEYLEREFHAETRSEFEDGELVDMAGVTEAHVLINMNLIRVIGNQLHGSPCRVYGIDFRLRIKRRPRYRYPDLMIICGKTEFDPQDPRSMSATNPRVLIEILSPTSETRDRGIKFDDYRSLESFEEYILVSQESARWESFRRREDGLWTIAAVEGVQSVAKIACMDLELQMSDIYANVTLPPPVGNLE